MRISSVHLLLSALCFCSTEALAGPTEDLIESNAYDRKPYTLSAVHVGTAGCVGGGSFGAVAWAEATHASPGLVAYLKSQGL